jgi:uncharacterized membrane protein AbrB (regulator of aidB expression)
VEQSPNSISKSLFSVALCLLGALFSATESTEHTEKLSGKLLPSISKSLFSVALCVLGGFFLATESTEYTEK